MRHSLNVFITVSVSALLLTIFEDFGTVHFQDIHFLPEVSDRVLNNINSVNILLLVINVDLN